jgi:hypothetical protein
MQYCQQLHYYCLYLFLYVCYVYTVVVLVMYYLFRKLRNYYRGRECHIFIVSFLVYVVINMIENYIHYNIGKNPESGYQIEFSSPSSLDWSKIAMVMLVFALLQGILTITIERYWNN